MKPKAVVHANFLNSFRSKTGWKAV